MKTNVLEEILNAYRMQPVDEGETYDFETTSHVRSYRQRLRNHVGEMSELEQKLVSILAAGHDKLSLLKAEMVMEILFLLLANNAEVGQYQILCECPTATNAEVGWLGDRGYINIVWDEVNLGDYKTTLTLKGVVLCYQLGIYNEQYRSKHANK